jgi:hypothetical protein
MTIRAGDSAWAPQGIRRAWLLILLSSAGLSGCSARARPPNPWAAQAERVIRRGEDTYLGFDFDRDGRLDYLQRLRAGYKDRLYFPETRGGPLTHVVDRPAANLPARPLLLLLLDGVACERLQSLWDQGCFRLFRRPARLVSVFPTLTDPAYDEFFGTGPSPGYEAGYYDRKANQLTNGALVYVCGRNEQWVRHSDYRLAFIEDALMYLLPERVYHTELRRARQVVDECLAAGRQHVVIYLLSTDALGHMLPPERIEQNLIELDAWIERLVYDYRGELELVTLADHGMHTTPPQRFRLRQVLHQAGLRVVDRLERPGDVAVPEFGLLDVARVQTFDAGTRERVVALLVGRPEVELLAVPDSSAAESEDDSVLVYAAAEAARIRVRQTGGERFYSYEPISGDPLKLADACAEMRAAGRLDPEVFASASAWLAASSERDFPAAVPRLWHGFYTISEERPDVVLSLRPAWFVGSGLFSEMVQMHGTHGGLHRRVTETFATTTAVEIDSPVGLREVHALIQREFGWDPASHRRFKR